VTARHDPASVASRATPAAAFAALFEHGRPMWLAHAACQDHDPDLFFPISAIGPGLAQTERAKQICQTCPVRTPCRDWAMTRAIPYGVWGGLSERDRATLIRRSSPARRQGLP
jgi:WhiB family transcriptional regulator, redox-sensing transcriptional regulator